ncbi:3517_t:CDS:2 [Paraglomus occultum]|uniref:3517_t:CDS:1 n=1 Tax=Paraglomus occultum TaxID=144539 RepID=A0A9N9F4Z7_9GLOM|nr:3517_t:CDS:2 [Paraglomus occultum]
MTDDVGYRNQESPLMVGFTNLRKQLASVSDLQELDAVSLLEPFLEVIRSGDTNGPITSTALSSVEKLLTYAIINKKSPNLPNAATHCKFEASDSVSDEFVLLKILQVRRLALTKMLRRSAEHTMVVMIQTTFQRLKDLSEDSDNSPSSEDEGNSNAPSLDSQVRMAPPDPKSPHLPLSPNNENEIPNLMTNLNNLSVSATEEVNDNEYLQIQERTLNTQAHRLQRTTLAIKHKTVNRSFLSALTDVADEEEDNEPRPFGLPSIRELLRVLISLLNPHDHQHTDTMRLMALSILNVAFEVGGRTMGRFESLRNLVVDDLCKSLFQREHCFTYSHAPQNSTVFDTLRPHLKFQQELYLSFLIERLTPASALPSAAFNTDISLMLDGNDSPHASGTSTPLNTLRDKSIRGSSDATVATGEVRELLLESLGQLAREPTFMVDLWVNYDFVVIYSKMLSRF